MPVGTGNSHKSVPSWSRHSRLMAVVSRVSGSVWDQRKTMLPSFCRQGEPNSPEAYLSGENLQRSVPFAST